MLHNPRHEDPLGRLTHQLRLAPVPTSDLFAAVIADACTRLTRPQHAPNAARIRWLIGACAWTDAALALIELELSQWPVRRLLHEDGEWLCSLSRQGRLPAELDEMAEAVHASLPLAILGALVEAQCHRLMAFERRAPTVPDVSLAQDHVLCCDNFA